MPETNREPRSPVSVERAMQHGLLAIRRAWASRVPDFEAWGRYELDPDPLVLHDLNGQILFYEFAVMRGRRPVGAVKTSASKVVGAAVPTIELTPRKWDPGKATQAATAKVREGFPKAEIAGTEFVVYSYPKIGVRVNFARPESGMQSQILDVASLAPVEKFSPDEPDGFTSWSFYERAERDGLERVQRWEQADRELEAARSDTPQILQPGFTARELPKLRTTFLPKMPDWQRFVREYIPYRSSKTIRFGPRCNTHECFELYAQKNNYFCAVATGQMILDFYRWYYTQDQIATAMSTTTSGTTNPGQVAGYESLSNNCLDATYDSAADWLEAKTEIDANRPLKSGVPGHARACAGWMRENFCVWPGPCRRWLKIYDPSPWNADICAGGSVYWEDWDTKTHTNFIYIRHRTTPCP